MGEQEEKEKTPQNQQKKCKACRRATTHTHREMLVSLVRPTARPRRL
jgi:hypothetical protein